VHVLLKKIKPFEIFANFTAHRCDKTQVMGFSLLQCNPQAFCNFSRFKIEMLQGCHFQNQANFEESPFFFHLHAFCSLAGVGDFKNDISRNFRYGHVCILARKHGKIWEPFRFVNSRSTKKEKDGIMSHGYIQGELVYQKLPWGNSRLFITETIKFHSQRFEERISIQQVCVLCVLCTSVHVCMYVLYVYMYVCMYLLCVCSKFYVLCVCVCICACVCMCSVCVYVYMYVCVSMCVCVCVCVLVTGCHITCMKHAVFSCNSNFFVFFLTHFREMKKGVQESNWGHSQKMLLQKLLRMRKNKKIFWKKKL